MHYDLMTELYRFLPFLFILLFWHWRSKIHCVIECVKQYKNLLDETELGKSEVTSVKIVTFKKKQKTWSKGKAKF